MADLPISGLTETGTAISTDLFAIVTDNATIPVSKNITWATLLANIKANQGAANSITSGVDADKSATPAVGDIYYATDVKIFYYCTETNAWSTSTKTILSDNLQNSNDTEKSTTSASYVKLKEIKLNLTLAKCRIKFDLKSTGSNYVFAQIYKNGAVVGTERTQSSPTYGTYTEDFSSFAVDDLIQIYAKRGVNADTASVRNMRLYYDFLLLAPSNAVTNQDPA